MTTPPPTESPPLSPPPVGARPVPLAIVSIFSLGTAASLGSLQLLWPGKAGDVPGIFGTVSSWISAGGIMGILSLLVWLQLGNRRLGVEETATRNADRADIRDHYADEVKQLRAGIERQAARHSQVLREIETRHTVAMNEVEHRYQMLLADTEQHYKNALTETAASHEACKKEVAELRDEIDGLRRQIIAQSADRVIALGLRGGEPPSDDVLGAAHRSKDHVQRGGADKPPES